MYLLGNIIYRLECECIDLIVGCQDKKIFRKAKPPGLIGLVTTRGLRITIY